MAYDEWTRRSALEARESGWRYEEIEATLGPSRRTVQMWAREAGLEERSSTRKDAPTDEDRIDAAMLYLGGMPSSDVGELYGVSRQTVCKWARWATDSRRASR